MAAQPFRGYEQRRDVERSADWEPLVVCSLKEGDAIDMERESQPAWIAHNRSNLSRVYPKGSRMDSSNMADTLLCRLWGAGVQMAALNFQTFDQSSMLNEVRGLRELSAQRDGGECSHMGIWEMWAQCGHQCGLRDNPSPLLHLPPPLTSQALFALNGGCGYVLKPPLAAKGAVPPTAPQHLELTIVSARGLPKSTDERREQRPCDEWHPLNNTQGLAPITLTTGGCVSPACEIELIGGYIGEVDGKLCSAEARWTRR